MAKKQVSGRGSIIKRNDGRWMAAGTIGGQRVYFYGATQKEASDKLDKALQENRDGIYIKPTKQTFGEWLDIWLMEYSKPVIRPTTFDSYEYLIRYHIKPGLGEIALKELQPSQIQKFYNRKLSEKKNNSTDTLSPRTVHYMHIIINQSLEQALKEGKIIRNPAKATKPPKTQSKEAGFLTVEELEKFFQGIAENRWYTALLVDVNSGLRRGELAALKWEDVNLQTGIIHVKTAVSQLRNHKELNIKSSKVFQSPKTKKGLRGIPLPSDVVNELKRWKAKQNQEKLLLQSTGLYQDQGFVFTWENGRMVDPGYLSKHFLKLVRKAGFTNIHLHNLRHSYASMLLKMNEHPKVVQELMGHATISQTLDTYSHISPGLKEKAAEKLNGLFTTKKSPLVEEN